MVLLLICSADRGPVHPYYNPCPHACLPQDQGCKLCPIISDFYRLITLRQWIIKNHFVSFKTMTHLQYLRSFFYIYICKAFLASKGYMCMVGGGWTFTGEGKHLQKWTIFFALLFLPRQRSIVLRDIYFLNQYVPELYLNHFTLYYIFSDDRLCCSSL